MVQSNAGKSWHHYGNTLQLIPWKTTLRYLCIGSGHFYEIHDKLLSYICTGIPLGRASNMMGDYDYDDYNDEDREGNIQQQ